MKPDRRNFITSSMLAIGAMSTPIHASAQSNDGPETISIRGHVVCLTEELEKLYQVSSDCENRGHVYSIKTSDGKIYPLLPTDSASAVWLDERYRVRDLQVTGRIFPGSNFIEVIKYQSWVHNKLHDLYYFCDVCMVESHKPGPCECCQEPVEFREAPTERRPPVGMFL